jgi:8-oxo-dGTP pyrophosphatase MutT (NUDIX family)
VPDPWAACACALGSVVARRRFGQAVGRDGGGGVSKRVRPRDAATLVLYRRQADGVRILMGQRHSGHVFMPDKFVFPGGRVDPADARVRPLVPLRPEVERKLARGSSATRARALAMAAIRETFEETGLLVGDPSPRVPRTRSSAWAAFLRHGVVPSLGALDFVARAITPPGNPRRFDARFFMADASCIHGDAHDELVGSGELLDLDWVPLERAQSLDLPEVTHMVVDEVRKRLAAADPASVPVPFVRFVRRGTAIEHL